MDVFIENNTLHITFKGWEKVWSLKRAFSIPLLNVAFATTKKPVWSWFELRAPGTFLPSVIKAGTFYTRRGKEFWYVQKHKRTLTIELKNYSFKRINLSLNNNKALAEIINNAVKKKR